MLVYCDSVVMIYYFDHTGTLNTRAVNRLASLAAAGARLALSDLVRLEYRVKPLSNGARQSPSVTTARLRIPLLSADPEGPEIRFISFHCHRRLCNRTGVCNRTAAAEIEPPTSPRINVTDVGLKTLGNNLTDPHRDSVAD